MDSSLQARQGAPDLFAQKTPPLFWISKEVKPQNTGGGPISQSPGISNIRSGLHFKLI